MNTFLFITVTDASDRSRENLERLLASLEQNSAENQMVLVVRGGDGIPPPAAPKLTIHPIPSQLQTPLSRARNQALAFAREAGLLDTCSIVAFPDDDCAYSNATLTSVEEVFAEGTDIAIGVYGPTREEVDQARFPPEPFALEPLRVGDVVSSGGIFMSSRAVAAVGDFDERFGLGARYGSAEDCDYVLRALEHGFAGRYEPQRIVVHHPYKAQRPAEYYVGDVALLAKHARNHPRAYAYLAYQLVLGLGYTISRAISPSQYGRALRATWQLTWQFTGQLFRSRSDIT